MGSGSWASRIPPLSQTGGYPRNRVNSTSAFSREGRHIWISKVIPAAWWLQIAAKFLHSYAVSLLGIVVAAVTTAVILGISTRTLVPAALLAAAGAAALTTFALAIDLARPQLKWTNPQVAIKQNMNVLAAMVVQMGFMAACGLAAHLLMKAGLSGTLVCLLLLAIALCAAGIGWRTLLTLGARKYPGIGV